MSEVRIVMTGHGRGEVFVDGEKMPGVSAVEFVSDVTRPPNVVKLTLMPELVEIEGPAAVIAQSERDGRRYRYLKRKNPGAVLAVAYQVRKACVHTEPDAAIDAAMGSDSGSAVEGER